MNNDQSSRAGKLVLRLDYRVISLLLVAVITGMLVIWKPWSGSSARSDRTVKVTGQATVSATPDEYVFTPSYQFSNDSKETALAELTRKSDEIVTKLKELKVPSSKIKTNSSNYELYYYGDTEDKQPTYTLSMTVTVGNEKLAQKVQDYLVTTTPSGSVSPQANFSKQKQQDLENEARTKAIKDARAKAEQSAENLGFSLGKVKAVDDGNGFGGVMPFALGADMAATRESTSSPSLAIQPGENELSYNVTVTYFVK